LQHYQQTTGHISLYYDSPWYDLNSGCGPGNIWRATGVTFQVTRRFSTGVELEPLSPRPTFRGAVREGSFDKGIIIRIPLAGSPLETQSQLNMDLRPFSATAGRPCR